MKTWPPVEGETRDGFSTDILHVLSWIEVLPASMRLFIKPNFPYEHYWEAPIKKFFQQEHLDICPSLSLKNFKVDFEARMLRFVIQALLLFH